jgi:CDP-glucose 4,6-dehydratase
MFQGLREAYQGKRVFLTGHTGFKGAWLLRWLCLLGADVKGYGLKSTDSRNLYELIKGDGLCQSVLADVRDGHRLQKEIVDYKPDFLFHLAAQSLVRPSYEVPQETFEINAMGTANVLQALVQLQGSCVAVMITTDKVYENVEWIYPYRENDRLGGRDPYSASKACAEIIISCYIRSFFSLPEYHEHKKVIGIGRAGNVIGGGDRSRDRIVPDIIDALENKRSIGVRNPKSVRPWQHVLEPIGAYLLLGQKLTINPDLSGEAWNFGPLQSDHLTVENLIQHAIEIWGEGAYHTISTKGQPHEAGLLKLDISKAMAQLNWRPKLTSHEAIDWTISWYRQTNANVLKYTDSQIERYSNL